MLLRVGKGSPAGAPVLGRVILAGLLGWGLAGGAGAAEGGLPALDRVVTPSQLLPETFRISDFRFEGNTVISPAELSAVTAAYTGRSLTWLELEQARTAVTLAYVQKGYVNSGAVIERLPDPHGVVTLKIIEGALTEAKIVGNKWLRKSFYLQRLGVRSSARLNVNRLRDELQVWRYVYPVEQVNAELRPGRSPGTALLDVTVKERFPFHLGLEYANDRPPSTGAEQIHAMLRADSVTGRADRLTFDSAIARGGDGMKNPQLPGTSDLATAYSLPITRRDTTLGLQYARSSAVVLEAPFRQLDIKGNSEIAGVSLAQPLWRAPNQELTVTLAGERKASQTFLLGVPYSFSPGAVQGESVSTAVRVSGQYLRRSPQQVMAARVTASWGIDALGGTVNASAPDGRFVSLLGQVQYLRRLGQTRTEIVLRVAGQYTPDPLLSVEQLGLGGHGTIRGYRENTLIRDTAVFGVAELRVTVWGPAEGQPYVQWVPFCGLGAGWNNGRATPAPRDIGSAGAGLVVRPCKQVEASLYWGHAFRNMKYLNRSLQDAGLHFRVSLWAF